ncbi:PIN domain-containing protein [Endozoicomonas sp.]|uniref:PIN domain-containing protein n=1 Tax=Endozoicomonas sp. TaxID=1892382 RepID=UPI002885A15A|nr:type II toxin-antitoxin system VapC family toxin [Endozoicomonas sp.]
MDTNILIRYIVQDDSKQSVLASQLIETRLTAEQPGFISLIVLIETVWVLGSCYQQTKSELLSILHQLITTRQLLVERSDLAFQAIQRYENGNGDFSDAVICLINAEKGCDETVTFDKKAKSVGMSLLS